MLQFIFRIIIIYLIYKLITVLISKGISYYRAYQALQRRAQEQKIRQREVNIRAFDIEDADYEEITPGKED
ncbi:MAG: hypothetical protein V1794_16335 [Candidatus Glassbacteria bacterium]